MWATHTHELCAQASNLGQRSQLAIRVANEKDAPPHSVQLVHAPPHRHTKERTCNADIAHAIACGTAAGAAGLLGGSIAAKAAEIGQRHYMEYGMENIEKKCDE